MYINVCSSKVLHYYCNGDWTSGSFALPFLKAHLGSQGQGHSWSRWCLKLPKHSSVHFLIVGNHKFKISKNQHMHFLRVRIRISKFSSMKKVCIFQTFNSQNVYFQVQKVKTCISRFSRVKAGIAKFSGKKKMYMSKNSRDRSHISFSIFMYNKNSLDWTSVCYLGTCT